MLGVNETRAGLGLALFAVASLIGLFSVTWLEVRHNTTDGVLETTVAIIHTMQSVVVVAAAWVYLTVEGSAMIAEKYLKKRYQDGRRATAARKDCRKGATRLQADRWKYLKKRTRTDGRRPNAAARIASTSLPRRLTRIAEKYLKKRSSPHPPPPGFQEAKRRGEDFDEPTRSEGGVRRLPLGSAPGRNHP